MESVTAPEPTTTHVRLRPEIAALPPYRQGRPAPANGFKLSSNENPWGPVPAVEQAIAAAAAEVNRYPDATALALHERVLTVWRAIDAPNLPANIKAALELQGRQGGLPRRPFAPATTEDRERIRRALVAANLIDDM